MSEERRALAATFDEDADLYDRVRPGYPRALFDDLDELTGLGPGRRVLEIGCGTGQATRDLARGGASVIAVEPGAALRALARRRLADVPLVEVVTGPFEALDLAPASLDAIAAFTAWHWLEPGVRTSLAAAALKPGGVLAIVATQHVAGGSDAFFAEVQACYERWDPATPPGLRLQPAHALPPERDEADASALFEPAVLRRYTWQERYPTAGYLDLLRSYSGHRALGVERRERLLACIAELIDRRHGGAVIKRTLNELRVHRRRGPDAAGA